MTNLKLKKKIQVQYAKHTNKIISKYKGRNFPGGPAVRVHLSMQETWVRSLVREDPTCHGATKALWHNYAAHTLCLLSS